ncbi:Adenylyl-sulfate kinase 3 [Stylosanthes scabra]|uniref:Adenylyl-sulfate kinase n=1 Tax=Stylosanthes scabra TaxID=79078 RepID=A0ABU6UT73_9FABA|nr:Adenylyl-sulfate kinase 3 [Stylosanthes scabra]
MSTVTNSTNIFWQECQIGKLDRQKLLNQKGCVVWITGLSGSGKSTLACSLGRELHSRGKLSYVLDGDNLRHGINKDLGFKPEDRTENIRRTGEVAKLFADAGLICVASLISPYRRDRDACRAMLSDGNFIEERFYLLCEERDPKGLYKLARSGKIKGFTGIDDPYEPPLNCEIEIKQENGVCPTPTVMAGQKQLRRKTTTYLKGRESGMVLNSGVVMSVAHVSANVCQYIACNPERLRSDVVLDLLFCLPLQPFRRLALSLYTYLGYHTPHSD